VVRVERQEATSGGGACGHSPACVILIPILVFDALFPKKWDEVSVTKNGKPIYVARFETNGDFIEGTQYQATKARYFSSLILKQLGRRVIVQIGEAALAPDGSKGEPSHTPILPQVSLLSDYEAALSKQKDEEERAALIVEAATWLGDESCHSWTITSGTRRSRTKPAGWALAAFAGRPTSAAMARSRPRIARQGH
jgi:hypothetical protein